MSLDDFRREPLLFGPSPIHPLPRLSEALGGQVEIWAKREDCNSGIAFGGNKVRKLEYLAAEALDTGCDTLVSIGGIQSNHTRQVTGVAAKLGLKAVTVQEGWVDYNDMCYDKVGNIQLTRIMGGDPRVDPAGFDIGYRDSWHRALDSVVEAGGKPYAIPAGASDHPLGGLGFANWAREVAAQEAELDTFFDTIIVCTVTGSTHAGMELVRPWLAIERSVGHLHTPKRCRGGGVASECVGVGVFEARRHFGHGVRGRIDLEDAARSFRHLGASLPPRRVEQQSVVGSHGEGALRPTVVRQVFRDHYTLAADRATGEAISLHYPQVAIEHR